MKRRIIIFITTLCLIFSPISFVFATDEGVEENITQVEETQIKNTQIEEVSSTKAVEIKEERTINSESINTPEVQNTPTLTKTQAKGVQTTTVKVETHSTTYVEDEQIKDTTITTRTLPSNTKTNVQSNTSHDGRTECYKATVNGEEVEFTTDNTSGVIIDVPQQDNSVDVEFYYRYIDQNRLYNFSEEHDFYIDCNDYESNPIYSKIDNQQQLHAGEQWFSISRNNGNFGFFKSTEVPEEYRDIYFYLASPSIEGGQTGTVKGDYNLQDGYPSSINSFTMIHDDTIVRYVYSAAGTIAIKYIDTEGNEIAKGKKYGNYPFIPYNSKLFVPLEIENYNFVETKHSITDLIYKAGVNDVVYQVYSLIQPPTPEPEEPEPEEPIVKPEEPNMPIIPPIQPENPTSEEPAITNDPEVIVETGGLGKREDFSYIETPSIVTSETTLETEETPTTINEEETPLTTTEGNWALINLIAAICSVIIALILLFIKKKKENEEEKYTDEEKNDILLMRIIKILSIIFAIISIILFILTEDMTLPMELTDKWTFIMLILFVIEIINFFIVKTHSKQNEDEE